MEALSQALMAITGDGGQSSFDPSGVRGAQACFVVARALDGKPVGCGAIRRLAGAVAELKRMDAVPGTSGVGSAVLAHFENEARALGYAQLWLSTRRVNAVAVGFSIRRGFTPIPSFGRYVAKAESVCMAKRLG